MRALLCLHRLNKIQQGLKRNMCSRKDQTIFNSPCLKFCQYGSSLFAEWHKVWCSNLGSPMRVQAVWANKKENINKTIRPLWLDGYSLFLCH